MDTNFKSRDAGSYDRVVDSFERHTESFTTPLARRMVELAGVRPGDEVLDVGTGTAVVAYLAAEAARRDGQTQVLGIDLSEAMLETCRRKEATLQTGARFEKMDAEELSLDEGSFDVVLSLFALTHFPNPLQALKEMHRVLRPGGRLVVAAGSGPPATSLSGWWQRLRKLADRALEPSGRRQIAPRSLLAWMRQQGEQLDDHAHGETPWAKQHGNRSAVLPRWSAEAGFVEVRTRWMGRIVELDTVEDFWDIQATNSSTLRKYLEGQTEERVAQLQARYAQHCARLRGRSGKLVYPYGAVFICAKKPG